MFVGGMAKIDHAPTSTMFIRAGGVTTPSKSRSSNVTEATGSSPAKVIDNRTKCYKQLSDLYNLFQANVFSQSEYQKERDAIVNMLQKLV